MGAPATAPNASSLPYELRPRGGALLWTLASSIALLVLPLLALAMVSRAGEPLGPAPLLLAAVMALLAVLGAARLWRLKDPQLRLFPDRLERPGLTSTRVLGRTEIAGVSRTIYSRSGSYFKILPQPGAGDPIALPAGLRNDPVLAEWLRGFPDPEVVAAAADRSAVLADQRYGDTEGARAARLRLARRMVLWFSIACTAVAAGVGLLNPPPVAAVGLAVACLGAGLLLLTRFDGLVVWMPRAGVRPSPLTAVLPAGVLAFRGLVTVHLMTPVPLMVAAAVVGLAAAALTYQRLTGAVRPAQVSVAAGVFAGLLAYGAAAYLDALPAGPPSRSYAVTVTDKQVSHGRSTSYDLSLAAWGDRPPGRVQVSSSLYRALDIGSTVCIDQYAGDLGIPWFEVGLCGATRGAAAGGSPPK